MAGGEKRTARRRTEGTALYARRLRASAVLAGATIVLAACSRPESDLAVVGDSTSQPLPMAIHGMPLVAVTTGPDAEALIQRLHGRDVAPLASYVGRYEGGGADATLYVSRLGDSLAADSLVERMSEAIGRGNRSFAHHTRFTMDELTIHVVLGQGQTHFFFARGPDVRWLAIDRGMARVGLADLLGVRPDRVPSSVVVGGINVVPPPDSLYHRGLPPARKAPALRRPDLNPTGSVP